MNSRQDYLFHSERLGFRNWTTADIPEMAAINADPEVMRYFPATATPQQTESFLLRMQACCTEKGYCYFATEELSTGRFIGFVGLMDQVYEAPFTPCVDIGWRLRLDAWGQGFATEGAKRCLEYAFNHLGMTSVIATAPQINKPSIAVMEKAGMKHKGHFRHPNLAAHERLVNCVYYEAIAPSRFL